MTLITRTIKRETPATVFDGGKRLAVCCTLAPEGLYLRQKGRRRAWLLPYPAAYQQAVKLAVAQERREKKGARSSSKSKFRLTRSVDRNPAQ